MWWDSAENEWRGSSDTNANRWGNNVDLTKERDYSPSNTSYLIARGGRHYQRPPSSEFMTPTYSTHELRADALGIPRRRMPILLDVATNSGKGWENPNEREYPPDTRGPEVQRYTNVGKWQDEQPEPQRPWRGVSEREGMMAPSVYPDRKALSFFNTMSQGAQLPDWLIQAYLAQRGY